MSWLVVHAGDVINKFRVGQDGKTSYERAKGKAFKREVVEFGERVFCRRGKVEKIPKIEVRWEEGIYLGMCWRTGGMFIGVGEEVILVHAIRRTPYEERWRPYLISSIKCVPWQMRPGHAQADHDVRVIHVNPELDPSTCDKRSDNGKASKGQATATGLRAARLYCWMSRMSCVNQEGATPISQRGVQEENGVDP